MSLNAHMCKTQSRRDDLEALGYVLVYLMTGSLPWQKISTLKLKANLTRIKISKLKHKPEMLCKVIFKLFKSKLFLEINYLHCRIVPFK